MAANPQPPPEPEQPKRPRRRSLTVSIEELWRLYNDEGLSLTEVGEQVGLDRGAVHKRLHAAGYKLRRYTKDIATEELIRLYREERLSCTEIGERVGLAPNSVHSRLYRAGCELRPHKENNPNAPTEKLWRLYNDEGLTLEQVAERVGMSAGGVSSRLRGAGYTLRSGKPVEKEIPKEQMDRIVNGYVQEKLSVQELAEREGLTTYLVWTRLRDAGVLRPRGHDMQGRWVKYKAELAAAAEAEQRITELNAKIADLQHCLAEASTAEDQTEQVEKLDLLETVRKKLAEPDKYMWMSADEVAAAFDIHRATFFRNRNRGRYPRLVQGPKARFSTSSVIQQLKNPLSPKKK